VAFLLTDCGIGIFRVHTPSLCRSEWNSLAKFKVVPTRKLTSPLEAILELTHSYRQATLELEAG
jgi:hypothetical protein